MAAGIVARDSELAALRAFLNGASGFRALVLEGDPGIGKTTLWQGALEQVGSASTSVLAAAGSGSEAGLAFTTLADVLEPVLPAVEGRLPPPQQRAIEIALLRTDPGDHPVDVRTIGTAALGALRVLARDGPVVLALDDLQWVDEASADALAFSLRRLRDEPIRLLGTLRPRESTPRSLGTVLDDAEVLRVAPLDAAALHRLIRDRLGLSLRRPALLRIAEASGGNPLHALELARALGGGDPVQTSRSSELDTLLRERLARLPNATRDALLSVAIMGRLPAELAERLHEPATYEPALEAQIIDRDRDGRLVFVHPLLGRAVYGRATAAERRRRHLDVARLLEDEEERALHLGLGTQSASSDVSATLARAAESARRRGAPGRAAELLDHALRLTPSGEIVLSQRRRLDAAAALAAAGDSDGAEVRLRALVADLADTSLEAEATREFASVLISRGEHAEGSVLLERALARCGAHAHALRSQILRDLVWNRSRSASIEQVVSHGAQAVDAAEASGDEQLLVDAIAAREYASFLAGRLRSPERLEQAIKLERRVGCPHLGEGPRAVRAYALMVTGDMTEARPLCHELLRAAEERGDTEAEAASLFYLARLETFAGRLDEAEVFSRRLAEMVEMWGGYGEEAAFAEAAIAALRGDGARTRALVREQPSAGASELSVSRLCHVLGELALSEGRPAEAVTELRRAEGWALERGASEPAATRHRLDLVEALVGIGELDEAEEVQERFETAARELDRGWALTLARRTRALILSARGDQAGALELLDIALSEIDRFENPLERARILLARGTIARRAKLRAQSRTALEAAQAEFERLGVPQWVERARAEAGRLGGKKRQSTELTPTERRVAEAVASGLSNKQAAALLFVSVRAIEANLTRIYAKLDVNNRTQLAARLGRSTEQEV